MGKRSRVPPPAYKHQRLSGSPTGGEWRVSCNFSSLDFRVSNWPAFCLDVSSGQFVRILAITICRSPVISITMPLVTDQRGRREATPGSRIVARE